MVIKDWSVGLRTITANRYLAEVNVGYNGTENFCPSKRFGWFPAYSFGVGFDRGALFPPK